MCPWHGGHKKYGRARTNTHKKHSKNCKCAFHTPRKKKPLIEVACLVCNKKILRKPHLIKRSKTGFHFCSTDCQDSPEARSLGYKTGSKRTTFKHNENCMCVTHGGKLKWLKSQVMKKLCVGNKLLHGNALKKQLIRHGLKEDVCEICELGDIWKGKPITLELDYINGNRLDNRLENLQIICPNCHSQTPTFRARNKKTKKDYTVSITSTIN